MNKIAPDLILTEQLYPVSRNRQSRSANRMLLLAARSAKQAAGAHG